MIYKVTFSSYGGEVYAQPDTDGHVYGEIMYTFNGALVYVDAESEEGAKSMAIEMIRGGGQ